MNIVQADIVNSPSVVEARSDAVQTIDVEVVEKRSWPFQILGFFSWAISRTFGVASAIFFLALMASIPLLQFISLGYLFEVVGRVGRSGKFRDGFVDLAKAAKLGRIVLGTWLCLWPIRIVTIMWYNAWLIDPTSSQTTLMRALQIGLIVLIVPHVLAAWFCGGRLRHFFWPLVAPFSIAIWFARKLIGVPAVKESLGSLTNWAAPGLVEDIANVKPIDDWFLPAVLVKNLLNGTLFTGARDRVWDYLKHLRLPYYFMLGLKGFAGSLLWLFGPTMLLIGSTMLISSNELSTDELTGFSFLLALLALMICSVVFAVLPALQAHFATQRRFGCFFEFGAAWRVVRGAPFMYLMAVTMMFVLAVPLFLFDIERIPAELIWTLVVVFMVLIWPGKILLGWAYGKGANREKPRPWWLATPIFLITFPLTFSYCFLLFFTRYTAWNGAWSLLENEVFLLPVPFWLI